LIIRCDSAAIVPNTSELLPEPETPVNTVSRRFGIPVPGGVATGGVPQLDQVARSRFGGG
jgi:hypothetical protein